MYKLFILIFIGFTSALDAQEVVSSARAVELALERNFGIQIAYNTLDQAENNKSILNSDYLPTITGTAGSTFNIDNTEAEFANGNVTTLRGAESSRYNAAVNLNYTLFDGMGRRYNYQRLKSQYELTSLEVRQTIENTLIQLFSVYYEVARNAENVRSLEETLEISQDRIRRAEYQFEYGQDTKLAVLNARVDINTDSINLINARQNLINSKRDLNLVVGKSLPDVFKVDTTIVFVQLLNKQELLERMKANNVDLLQVEKNIEISDFVLKNNRSGYLPSLGLTGTYGWNKNNNNPAAFLSTSTTDGFSASLNLNWNIFDGGRTRTQVKNALLDLENQNLTKSQRMLEIETTFNNAWDDYQNKLVIYRVQQENIKTARNNFERTEEKFKLGQATSIEFRQAQVNLLGAEIQKNQAKYDAKLSELNLLQLSGDLLNQEF